MKTTLATLLLILSFTAGATASTIVVNSTVDPGDGVCNLTECTLREGITAANTNPGADIITFNISGAGVHTITPTSALPSITEAVTIDGYTQPGASENTLAVGDDAVLLIQIDGTSAGLIVTGLVVSTDGCLIRGLAINRFSSGGFNVNGEGNIIEGNFVGTNTTGTADLGNGFRGVSITNGDNNIVGGTLPGARNLISGNGDSGVVIFCCDDTGNVIQGNYIGTDRNGTAALPNDLDGININSTSFANQVGGTDPGAGNLISGNGQHGINITDGGGGVSGGNNIIEGNLIGTDATGTAALGNTQNGIEIENSPDNIIGGIEVGARNVLSGNDSGVQIDGETASGNVVLGNFIGTNAAGDAELGNDQNGVLIIDAPDNIIGGATAGAGNVISGNGFGIQIVGAAAVGTQVQGNLIGTDAAGRLPLPNASIGVYIFNESGDTTVGGLAGAGNIIAFNGGAGVNVGGGLQPGTGNHIFGNSIFGNERLGIDLAGGTEDANDVTANDVGDADAGPNNLQNYPAINEIAVAGASRTVEGQLNSAADTDYTIDFYSNAEVDPSGYGEGETYLGSLDVHTSALGEVFFSFPLEANAAGQFITATATDPDGNTSEFSMASEAVPAIGRFLNVSTRLRVHTGENVLIGGFIITGTAPADVLLRAIGPSLGDFGVQDFLANPTLELHYSDGTVVTNDDWRDTQEAEIIATGIPPDDDLESAILATLDPGAYTAIVSGVNGGIGVGLVEAYDLSATDDERFANVSTRGLVETGDDVMIGGVIVGSNTGTMARVVVRAIGPSLTDLGVTGALQDPRLELFDSNGVMIQADDNWKDSQQAEIEATGLAPSDDRESALVRDLAPGAYTAIVRGVDDTTGVGLVEAYDIQ
jgi:CSLREA domain-containing protein